MENDIMSVYKGIDTIILKNLMFQNDGMLCTQSFGYNGFKRLHRVNSKELFCEHLKLANNYFDKYRNILDNHIDVQKYRPNNLKEHLENWNTLLSTSIKELGKLNADHIKITGLSNRIVECVMKQFLHDYEKVNRWYKRFTEVDWFPHDLHIVDDFLHAKMKVIEEG